MIIRKAEKADIVAVAAIHKDRFKNHFLGKYSSRLIEKYYESFLGNIFLVSESQGELNGFILGGESFHLDNSKMFFLKNYRFRYVVETLIRPSVYVKAAKRFVLFSNQKEKSRSEKESIRLLSIAVSTNHSRQGISTKLLSEFEHAINGQEYGLSVHDNNDIAIKFYIKNGFKLVAQRNTSLFYSKKL